jgi:hypothetical protein
VVVQRRGVAVRKIDGQVVVDGISVVVVVAVARWQIV